MLKKRIDYVDYDGNKRSEDLYFNLSKAEIAEMELSTKYGLSVMLQKLVDEEDAKKIMEIFKDLILKSIGEKSPDGKRFVKNQEIIDNFVQTEAYSELFIELATNADKASEFIKSIIPAEPTKVENTHPALSK